MELPKFTRLSKAICIVLCAGYLLRLVMPRSKGYLALVPGRTLPCIWNVLTGGFYIQSWVEVLVECGALLMLARAIEPYQGSLTFLIFMVVTDVCTCFASFLTVYLLYATTREPKVLYWHLSGFHGILAGLLVAYKQIMPDHELKLGGPLSIQARWVPSIVCVVSTLICVTLHSTHYLLFILWGTYTSWLYLRFFQPQGDSNLRGDPSEDFSFASFFPPFAQKPVDLVAGLCGTVFRLQHKRADLSSTPSLPVSTMPLLGSDAQDAQRRRERGVKALEERLSAKPPVPQDVETATPDI